MRGAPLLLLAEEPDGTEAHSSDGGRLGSIREFGMRSVNMSI
jgi:hypothetical protein